MHGRHRASPSLSLAAFLGRKDADVSFAILAGGRARRLGGLPKGLLLRQGRPLLESLLALAPRFEDTFLVTSEPTPYQRFGVRAVGDVVPGRGAPGGVHAALAQARTPWVLAVAADMPFVTPAVVERLLAERNEALDAVGFEVNGRLEPLLALYRSALAPAWEAALATNPSFPELWQTLRAGVLPEEALAQVDPGCRAVVSVNTPEDARAFAITLPGEA
jgi:molybdopterin-guanine dinucleotide biosynthesis protein A